MRVALERLGGDGRVRVCGCVGLFVLGLLFVGWPSLVGRVSGYDVLSERTLVLIDEGMAYNERMFLIFSAVKASLALVEGSTVGVGVEVQVGDLIQPVYDYVDYFWKVFLTAFVIMGFYKILLETGMLTLGFSLIGMGFMIWALSMLIGSARWNGRVLARRLMLLGLLMTYVLPVSLLASDLVSESYVKELKVQHRDNINGFKIELESTRWEFLELKDEISLLNPAASLEKIETGLVSIAQSIARSFQLSFLSFMYFVLIVLFESLILPFFTAFVLYLIGRRMLEGTVIATKPVVQAAGPATASAME